MGKVKLNYFITRLCFCLLALYLSGCSSSSKPPSRAFPVIVAEVTQEDVPVYLEAIGNVYSWSTVQVRAQVSGKLLKAHVQQGQDVKKGDQLFTIDPKPYQAALDKAKAILQKDEATLAFDKQKVTRYQELVKKNYVAQLTYDQYATDVKTLEAQVAFDKADVDLNTINLAYCYILSPIDGRISQFTVDPGNIVTPNDTTPITEIRQITPANVQFALPQKDFQEVKKIFKQTIKFEVLLQESKAPIQTGEVYFIDNHVDLSTGTILLKGRVENKERILWPGEFVRVRLLLKTTPKAILVPPGAVQVGQQGKYVYVLKADNTVDLRIVTTGVRYNNRIVIEKGLNPHEIVVVDGQINLRPGIKVSVTGGTTPGTPATNVNQEKGAI